MEPERKARKEIDKLLTDAGWIIQNNDELDLSAGPGVAIREFQLKTKPADYVLFLDGKAAGILEAKPVGTTLSGVAEQSDFYANDFPEDFAHYQLPLPFVYESTGEETSFRDLRDPEPRSRMVFAFHSPQELKELIIKEKTLRSSLKEMPPLIEEGLRTCQVEAITNLEKSLYDGRPRSLIQMATGSGKTYTAVTSVYRLIKYGGAKRVLFLVDRSNLGRQTLKEFQQYVTPDDGRKFTELYNVQLLTTNTIDPVSRVCITTIQRLYSMLLGERDFEEENEEESLFEEPIDGRAQEVNYNPKIPISEFDFIITDECHRSIYNLWRQVLEYFDAFLIGLTATPSKQTLGFFHQNLVMEYGHERAVADGVNVGYEVYRIKTKISEKGSSVSPGWYVQKRDKRTRRVRWDQLDEKLEYTSKELDRSVVSSDAIRTVIKTFKDVLFTELFPGRTEVPKTLVFAKDDSHAEDIVRIMREEFGKGNDFCKKITYKTTGESPENLIKSFRNSYNPRIAVTVDMVSTGTDIKPLECILFMRDVKSSVYFEQMKGRGTRTISETDLQAVTGDALYKTHFVIVDAVGVCEADKTDSKPLETKRNVSFEKLMKGIVLGKRDGDSLSSLASRLTRLDKMLSEEERTEIEEASNGLSLKDMSNRLLDAIDPDKIIDVAKETFKTEKPSQTQLKDSSQKLATEACKPFNKPVLRNTILEIKQRNEQVIDDISKDEVTSRGFDGSAKEKAKKRIETFKKFIEENKDELTALQLIYGKKYGKRHLTYEAIKELAEAIKKPPYNLSTQQIWNAYEQLERSKVQGAGPQKLLTNIISLIRFTTGDANILEPFPEYVEERFKQWLTEQKKRGQEFSLEQLEWLTMIKKHIAASLEITRDDFEEVPFNQKGGLVKASKVFGSNFDQVIEELNGVLVK
jgi:type I restriction enzyme, R subunit